MDDVTKRGLAQMLKGGVIMDVVNAEQAKVAEEAGAVAVMALEKVPSDIRLQGGVARMCDPIKIKEIQAAVSIPVMAKARIGHVVEAQILEALEVDFIDESEVLTPADTCHIAKQGFKVPFVCGCRGLDEALRRIDEGAAMIRTKGEAGTGNVAQAVSHVRALQQGMELVKSFESDEALATIALKWRVPVDLVAQCKASGKLPVVNFAAGGIATPADAALMMQMGMDGVFVGSGIFKSENPAKMAHAIVRAVASYDDPAVLAQVSADLGQPMHGIAIVAEQDQMAQRGN